MIVETHYTKKYPEKIINEKITFKKDNNNGKLELQYIFISHLVISSYPPFTIPRLQTKTIELTKYFQF